TLGLISGDRARVTTARGTAVVTVEVTDTMQSGHISLPNGHGMSSAHERAVDDGAEGASPNELTDVTSRDPFAGTPWHKFVPANVEALD
ncbi:MAG: molybdopterin oxidoreductase family protein, partial [Deltaproteobacteria bacterium]